jgi:excisionase family DNA binding protein
MPKIVKPAKPLCQLYSLPEAAGILGVSVATMRSWVWMRKIDVVHVGRSVRVRKDTLEELVNAGSVPALVLN